MFNASLSVLPQYLLPKQAMTVLAGHIANASAGRITTFIIRQFIQHYGVNMDEAVNPDIHSYRTFNDFFTRALLAEKRPIAQADYVCPADGIISQLGIISGDRIFQAKGRNYSATTLVGGDSELAGKFCGGHFATVVSQPQGLPPGAYALQRAVDPHDPCSRHLILGEPQDSTGSARTLRAE